MFQGSGNAPGEYLELVDKVGATEGGSSGSWPVRARTSSGNLAGWAVSRQTARVSGAVIGWQ